MSRLALLLAVLILLPSATALPLVDSDIPVNADATQPIPIFINVTSDLPVDQVLISYVNPENNNLVNDLMSFHSGNQTNGTWNYTVPRQNWKGTLEVWIIISDISGASVRVPSTGYVTINLEGPEKPKPFPWSIVLIVGFLAVALIATELIFKPGLYRKTGRQRAAELEEEDRKRELEQKGTK